MSGARERERPVFFEGSPFSLMASEFTAHCWAGRRAVLDQLTRLHRGFLNRPDSTLDLMWASLGAGKTHALYYFEHVLCFRNQERSPSIVCFLETPENTRQFLDIYRRVAATLPLQRISELALPTQDSKVGKSLLKAARGVIHGEEHVRALVADWISGGRPHLRDLRNNLGIDHRIESDDQAERLLSEIISLMAVHRIRFILLIDEFQRIGFVSARVRESVLASLRSVFNRNPTYFSVLLAAGSSVEKTALGLLPPELKTIMGMRPTISLPEMDKAEALEFVEGRFRCFRPSEYHGAPFAPFSSEILEKVISVMSDERGTRLIPRTVLQTLGMVYDELMDSPRTEISVDWIDKFLKGLRWEVNQD